VFLRLLWESFVRQRRRKALAGLAILLGTTAVTAMLALATTIGDRIHAELAVYGANIVVYPKAEQLEVKVGGVDVKPATGGAYLHESDLEKLNTIFWANNITGISPELSFTTGVTPGGQGVDVPVVGVWFDHPFGHESRTGVTQLNPSWRLVGRWPKSMSAHELVIGRDLAYRLGVGVGSVLIVGLAPEAVERRGLVHPPAQGFSVTGIVTGDSRVNSEILLPLAQAQVLAGMPDAIDRVEISARTKPEDAFAREDPDKLSPQKHEIWYCSPYANSIAYQIREAIPGAQAEQVRRIEQSEGTVLERISGLMWLVSLAALIAAGFAVSAAMATAVLERLKEIGLMRSLGASQTAIAGLFYAEAGLLAAAAGTLGYLAGSALAFVLGARIFPGDGMPPLFNPVLLPVVLAMALLVSLGGSTPSILAALRTAPADTLRGNQ
jgi:putative ABC transport system permease protein